MRKPRKSTAKTPRRNPHARALGKELFRPRIVKNDKGYVRKPKHPKPTQTEEPET